MADDAGPLGRAHTRIDGPAKVTGRALYPSDEVVGHPAWAFLVTSAIARGRIAGFDLAEARAVPGVLDILTHENVGGEAKPPEPQSGGETTTTLQSDRIWHDGQIIGVIVAETYEAAREAAHRVQVRYEAEAPSATFDCPGVEEEVREPGEHKDFHVGDAAGALAAAEVVVDAWYETPTQHHNPIELFTTTCAWNDGHLTIWEPSQFVYGLKNNVAKQIGIDPERVRVISKFVGGAFGSKGGVTARTAWIAIAARRIDRPVKLVSTRSQGFTIVTYRAETRHHLQLGATRDGKLTALRHEGWEVTSRPSDYNVSGTETTARMYAVPNIETKVNIVHADRNTPGFMRAPPDTPYMFPLETAMDELAEKLGLDPIELRRINDTQIDPATGRRYSSRLLMTCFDQAAERFGWARRDPRPGSMMRRRLAGGLGLRQRGLSDEHRRHRRPGHPEARRPGAGADRRPRYRHRRLHRRGDHRRRASGAGGGSDQRRTGRQRPAPRVARRRIEPHRHHQPRHRQDLRRPARPHRFGGVPVQRRRLCRA